MIAEENKPLLTVKEFKVYAYDIDIMGIVSNIVYIRWFEDLRTKFLDENFPYEKMIQSGGSPILAKTEIEYKYPITYFDKPIGEAWISEMKRSKWEMCFKIYTGDKINCIGKQTGYYVNLTTKRPMPAPEELINKYLAAINK
jgi:acyl-CoA thioester hydrolase